MLHGNKPVLHHPHYYHNHVPLTSPVNETIFSQYIVATHHRPVYLLSSSLSYSETNPNIVTQSVVNNTSIDCLSLGSGNNNSECPSITSITNELCERKWRETNFVIHNLPETTSEVRDAESVKEIIEEIMQHDCTQGMEKDTLTNKPRIYRMGRQVDGRRRTIKVHLRSATLRESIMSNSRRSSSSEKYNSVVVQRDMTVLERRCLKELVIEKKKRNDVARH